MYIRRFLSQQHDLGTLLLCVLCVILIIITIATGGRKQDTPVIAEVHDTSAPTQETEPQETPVIPSNGETATIQYAGGDFYCLQLGVFSNPEKAQSCVRQAKILHLAGYILQEGSNQRILCGSYLQRSDAQRQKDYLQEKFTMESYIKAMNIPAVNISVQGQGERAQALAQGYALVIECFERLHQIQLEIEQDAINNRISTEEIEQMLKRLEQMQVYLRESFISTEQGLSQVVVSLLNETQTHIKSVEQTLLEYKETHTTLRETLLGMALLIQQTNTQINGYI